MAAPNVFWNPADCSPNLILSNGNTTATKGSDGGYSGVRATSSYSTGLRYFEATVPGGNEGSVGLAKAAAPLDAPLGYASDAGIGLYADGTLWLDYSAYSTGSLGDTRVGFLIDLTALRLWVKDSSGTWVHGGDPSSGGEGIDISILSTPLFPMMCGYYADETSTIYSNSDTITLGLPAGATLWGDDGGTGTPDPIRKPIRSVYWFSAPGDEPEEPGDLTTVRWTMNGLTTPVPASDPAFPDATLHATKATVNGTNLVLNKTDYIDVASPQFGLPTNANSDISQMPSVVRLSFKGGANTTEATILLDLTDYGTAQLNLNVPWMLDCLSVDYTREQGAAGEEQEQIDSDVGDLKLGTNALYEVEWTDDPTGAGGTFRFYVDGVQLGAAKPSLYKVMLSDNMDVNVNASIGGTSNSRNSVEVEYIEVAYKA